jgi:gas vesicle protein
MSHSPYEPAEGVGRGVGQDPSTVYQEVGLEVSPGSAAADQVTPVAPVDDLYAPLPDTGSSSQQSTGTSASDVKDTAADQGRRVADTAKESAAQVKDTAVEQGHQVAAVAKNEVGQVAQQAAGSFKDIVSEGRTQLTNQVGTSQNRLAEYVHSLSDELGTMASGGGDGTGPLADLAHRYARQGGELSHWLSEHEPADVLNEVTRFARRRPWAFLGASLLTGVVVGRVTRSLAAEAKDEHDAQQPDTSGYGSGTTPAVSGPDYAAPVGTPVTAVGYETTGYQQTGYEETTPTTGYTSGYVAGDLPESPAPQTWTGGSR